MYKDFFDDPDNIDDDGGEDDAGDGDEDEDDEDGKKPRQFLDDNDSDEEDLEGENFRMWTTRHANSVSLVARSVQVRAQVAHNPQDDQQARGGKLAEAIVAADG